MADDFVTPDELEGPDNRSRMIIISIVAIVLLCTCCFFFTVAWYLGDSVVELIGS